MFGLECVNSLVVTFLILVYCIIFEKNENFYFSAKSFNIYFLSLVVLYTCLIVVSFI